MYIIIILCLQFTYTSTCILNIVCLNCAHLYARGGGRGSTPPLFFFCWITTIRDRPFNLQGGLWFFVSFRIFFFGQHELEYLFFFQNLTLGYTTKTLNHIFFFLHQNQNLFFSNIGNQNIFLEKNHNHPLQVKWSFP